MAKSDEKNKAAATPAPAALASETLKQPEITGGQQLAETANPVAAGGDETDGASVLTSADSTGTAPSPAVTPAAAAPAAGADTETDGTSVLTSTGQQPAADWLADVLRKRLAEMAATAEDTGGQERWTIQAVAVPNNRRMRAGRVFTDEPLTVNRADFSDGDWQKIENDLHLKIRRLDD